MLVRFFQVIKSPTPYPTDQATMEQTTYEQAQSFLSPYLPPSNTPGTLPHVTLTFAQSLDGCIGLSSSDDKNKNKPIALSGPESLTMTHILRNAHDAIMVGIGTVMADDPSLTVRHVPELDAHGRKVEIKQPRPVVVDPHLKIPLECKVMKHPRGKPIVFAKGGCDLDKKSALESFGCHVVVINSQRETRLEFPEIFRILFVDFEIKSVMVEGGASVISSLLDDCLTGTFKPDALVVTIAPRLLGASGVRPGLSLTGMGEGLGLTDVRWQQFGKDIVLAARP